MKTKFKLCLIFFVLGNYSVLAQDFTFGIENGINFSNIRKKFDTDRFASEPGPINGIFAKYQPGNWFVIQSGLNHATIHFNETNYGYWMSSSSSYFDPTFSSSSIAPYYPVVSTDKYSFLRIPLLIKFKTPGRVNFEIGGGVYYAFLTNDEFRGKDHDQFTKEYRDDNFPPMNDWGLILASSVNYNINNRWSIFASGQITYGNEEYFENVEGKMGSTELTFGVGYKPFAHQKEFGIPDSLGSKVSILPHSGINISNARSKKNDDKYHSSIGFSSGVSLKIWIGGDVSILTGAWYDRKGYNLDYEGNYPAIYFIPYNDQSNTLLKSDVQLDYLTIPLMMDMSFGKKIRSGLDFGVYFSLLQNAFTEGERTMTFEHNQGYQVQKDYLNESLDLFFKNFDSGLMFAYRMDVPVFTWADAFVSVNQSIGIKNILNNSKDARNSYNFIDNEKIRNSSTGIQFGLSIPVNNN